MLIIDSHCDTPSQIMRLRDLSIDNKRGQVDFPKLKKGGVSTSFFALYTSASMQPDAATRYALEMLAGIYDSVNENSDYVSLAYGSKDILENYNLGKISIMIGMENGAPIQCSLSLLRLFYKLGVRYMTLTHNRDNAIADAAAQGFKWGGLSPFGIEVVEQMNRLGMLIDVAHSSDKTFWDCIKYSHSPIVSTHSCCRALTSHRRNMTDEMIRAMADKGGVIQINFYPAFISDTFAADLDKWEKLHPEAEKVEQDFIDDPGDSAKRMAWERLQDSMNLLKRPGVKEVVNHIAHAINVGGVDSVGIGSDFDGIDVTPIGLENVSKIQAVFDEMNRRGYNDDVIEKVAGKNFLRVLTDVESLRQS